MKLKIYSIYDRGTEAYMRPWYAQADNAAIRAFIDTGLDATHEIARHPEDYTLMRIGVFDDNSGEITPEIPKKLLTGLEAIAEARKVDKAQLEAFDESLSPGGTD